MLCLANENLYHSLQPQKSDCCAGDSLEPRVAGEKPYEKIESEFVAKSPFVQIVLCSSSFVEPGLARCGAKQGSACRGRAEHFRTARRASTPSRSAESASAPSLPSWHAEGRGSAQSFEWCGLCGVLDSRGGRRSFVRRYCQARICEAAPFFGQRSGATRVRRGQSAGSNCLQR